MTKRFVWNFELSFLNDTAWPARQPDPLRWEMRFFFEEKELPITLHGLPQQLLDLSRWKIRERKDRYYLLPDCPVNIKQRHNDLWYKPLLEKNGSAEAYGKKISLSLADPSVILHGEPAVAAQELMELVRTQRREIAVEKTALLYKLDTSPPIRLEVARLCMQNNIFFSVSVEGFSQTLVTEVASTLLNQGTARSYVSFLRGFAS